MSPWYASLLAFWLYVNYEPLPGDCMVRASWAISSSRTTSRGCTPTCSSPVRCIPESSRRNSAGLSDVKTLRLPRSDPDWRQSQREPYLAAHRESLLLPRAVRFSSSLSSKTRINLVRRMGAYTQLWGATIPSPEQINGQVDAPFLQQHCTG
jgi:hypothetical protein